MPKSAESIARWNASPKRREASARYRRTEKGRAANRRGNEKLYANMTYEQYIQRLLDNNTRRRAAADARDQEAFLASTDARTEGRARAFPGGSQPIAGPLLAPLEGSFGPARNDQAGSRPQPQPGGGRT